MSTGRPSLVIVGAGPRGTGLLERITANAPEPYDADGRVLERSGTPHSRHFALGPHTDARGSGAFTPPRTGGPAFRQNDATARAALTFLRALSCRVAA
jgi:hypothetical protein